MAMIRKLILALFGLLTSLSIYDAAIRLYKHYTGILYSVNLSVLYYVSIYGFMVVIALIVRKYAYHKMDRLVALCFALVFAFRVVLHLSVIPIRYITGNMEWSLYNNITSNIYVDYVTWGSLVIALIIVLCQKGRISQELLQRFF